MLLPLSYGTGLNLEGADKTQVPSVCVARVVSCLWSENLVSAF